MASESDSSLCIPPAFAGEPSFLLNIICTLNFYISKKGAIFAKIWHKPLD